MSELAIRVRVALKEKWMNNDHDIDIKRMAEYFKASEEELVKIIRAYEGELLATKFNLR